MAEKMLVAQALDEMDLLVKKISDKIMNARFVDTVKENETKVYEARIAKEDFEKEANAAFQQIMDLIDRYQKLEEKIVNSNANTYIETSHGTISVASAIVRRANICGAGPYEDRADLTDNLMQAMRLQYDQSVQFAESRNEKLRKTAEQMLLSIIGKDSQEQVDRPLDVIEAYVKRNTTELVDPLSIQRKIEELSEKREDFLRELDTQIKVSNATTYIEL